MILYDIKGELNREYKQFGGFYLSLKDLLGNIKENRNKNRKGNL